MESQGTVVSVSGSFVKLDRVVEPSCREAGGGFVGVQPEVNLPASPVAETDWQANEYRRTPGVP